MPLNILAVKTWKDKKKHRYSINKYIYQAEATYQLDTIQDLLIVLDMKPYHTTVFETKM